MSRGQVGRGLFALGGIGAIILTVASVIMAVIGLWPLWILSYSFIWYLILITGLVLLLIGSIFVGIAYYAFYRHFERPIGIAGLVFGVICSVALLVFAVIGMFPTTYGPYYPYYPYYLSPFGLVLYWLGLLLFGTMLVIWGVASIVIRKSTSMPGLSLATGIMLIVAGCFVASFFLTFVGFILLLAAQIMNAIVFLKMAVSQN
jgi:hypothetical protein